MYRQTIRGLKMWTQTLKLSSQITGTHMTYLLWRPLSSQSRNVSFNRKNIFFNDNSSDVLSRNTPTVTGTLSSGNCRIPQVQRYLAYSSSSVFLNKATLNSFCELSVGSERQRRGDGLLSRNKFHTSTATCAQASYSMTDNGLELAAESSQSRPLHIPYVWLRDHCRSDRYYNHQTSQKNADPGLLEKDLTRDSVLAVKLDGGTLFITWRDGHKTEYPVSWLLENFYPGQFSRGVQRKYWTRDSLTALPVVSHGDHMSSEEGLLQTVSNLVKWGFSIVEGAPASVEGTRSCVERISYIQDSLFGQMWSFTSDATRSDTAFSNIALQAHTDTTYMNSPFGLQVFQCLGHDGSGGETLLVDGFKAVDELRKNDPRGFKILCETVIPHEYLEVPGPNTCGYHLYSLGTVVTAHPSSGEILHLRFNPLDRAPLDTVKPHDSLVEFYKAYDKLCRLIARQEKELWVKLKPGMVLLIDNWRVMHGRSAFDGNRFMCGCYVGRDDWVSKARMLGVL